MKGYDAYQLVVAAILFATSALITAYALKRRDARPQVLRIAALLTSVGGVCWAASAFFSSPSEPERVQTAIYNVRAVPFDASVICIAWLVNRSIGHNHPKTSRWLSTAPYVLGVCWLAGLIYGLLNPLPAAQEFGPTPPDFLVLKIRNLAELFYVTLGGVIFLREALAASVASVVVRLQNLSMAFACACFFALTCNFMYGSVLRVMPQSSEKVALLKEHLSLEAHLLGAAGVGYTLGLVLYHSQEERERILELFRAWIRLRHEVETDLDFTFPAGLSNGVVTAYFYRAAVGLASSPGGFPVEDRDKSMTLFKLLALLTNSPTRQQLALSLLEIQTRLSRTSDVSSRILVRIDGDVRYDIAQDLIFEALKPALSLKGFLEPLDLQEEDTWVQLAAVMAADARFLDSSLDEEVMRNPKLHINEQVVVAYEAAKREEGALTNLKSSFEHSQE